MKYYQNKTKCWELYAKKRIRKNFQREGAARNKGKKTGKSFIMLQYIRRYAPLLHREILP